MKSQYAIAKEVTRKNNSKNGLVRFSGNDVWCTPEQKVQMKTGYAQLVATVLTKKSEE